MNVFGVIHVKNIDQAVENAEIAFSSGFNGVFVINHGYLSDEQLIKSAWAINNHCPDLKIGINILGMYPPDVFNNAGEGMDMIWSDNAHTENSDCVNAINQIKANGYIKALHYGGVAFKYQAQPADLLEAGRNAIGKVDILTTSGDGTGIAPALDKLQLLSEGFGQKIAIASGVTPENIKSFIPYVDHVLVSTGISRDFYNFDPDKCNALIHAIM
jgi:predicted TIM-barrel enzyme